MRPYARLEADVEIGYGDWKFGMNLNFELKLVVIVDPTAIVRHMQWTATVQGRWYLPLLGPCTTAPSLLLIVRGWLNGLALRPKTVLNARLFPTA